MNFTTFVLLAFSAIFEFIILFEIVYGTLGAGQKMNLEQFSFSGIKNKYNARIHRQARFGRSRNKTPTTFFATSSLRSQHMAGVRGHAIINGEYVETDRILFQKNTPRGIAYYPYGKPQIPVFIRTLREFNKKYVVFQDPYLPPGEGYLVVLKKMPLKINRANVVGDASFSAMTSGLAAEIPYEAFHLHLSSNIQGTFDRLNIRKFAYGIRTKFSERRRARLKWLNRRKLKARRRMRFSVAGTGRWRGKRSLETFAQDWRNQSSLLNLCYISPLNVTRVRLMVNGYDESEYIDDDKYDDFDNVLL